MALHATTIRFADRAYLAIARAADAQGISVSQYVREAALIRAVLDELDSAEDALHTAHDLPQSPARSASSRRSTRPDRRAEPTRRQTTVLRSCSRCCFRCSYVKGLMGMAVFLGRGGVAGAGARCAVRGGV